MAKKKKNGKKIIMNDNQNQKCNCGCHKHSKITLILMGMILILLGATLWLNVLLLDEIVAIILVLIGIKKIYCSSKV